MPESLAAKRGAYPDGKRGERGKISPAGKENIPRSSAYLKAESPGVHACGGEVSTDVVGPSCVASGEDFPKRSGLFPNPAPLVSRDATISAVILVGTLHAF